MRVLEIKVLESADLERRLSDVTPQPVSIIYMGPEHYVTTAEGRPLPPIHVFWLVYA